MKPITTLTVLMLCCLGRVSIGFAEDEPVKPAADLLKGAIDPVLAGTERALFLKAAGVDSELDESEFNASKSAGGGFVRTYERYSTLLMFDKNRDKQLDWFEADAYRRAVRAAVLTAYDKDGNQRLTGQEREAANKALASGKLPRVAGPNAGVSNRRPGNLGGKLGSKHAGRVAGKIAPPPTNEERRRDWEQLQSRLAEKYDRDGNGKLNTKQEWEAARGDIREHYRKQEVDRFDTDGDGKVSDQERRVGHVNDRRAYLRRSADRNGDGQLDSAEQEAFDRNVRQFKDRQEHDGQARTNFMNKFDEDGDGELNDAEKKAIGPYYEKLRGEVNKAALKHFDSDGNGELSQAERDAGLKEIHKEGLEKYDTDGDGQLSFKERTYAMRSSPEEAEWLYHLYITVAAGRKR